ncbi:MAG TPA: EamA family transporter [Candidatus Acidoferrales bacterium]|nr:EamA family transporter [Candidatus Acidoferrales bacterium]
MSITPGVRYGVDMPRTPLRRPSRSARANVPPQAYFVGSALFHYLGPSFAVLLFARVDVLGVAWLRIAAAAVVFAVWRRPWRGFAALDRGGKGLIVALGAVFAVMNVCFYESIDRLPLATVAAIEFIGPIVLAVVAARIGRNFLAVGLATAGVYLLTNARFEGGAVGVACAFANAALFAAYIILAHRVSRRTAMGGIDGLAGAMMFGLVFVTPVGLVSAAHAFGDPVAIAAGVGVGVSSSVIPYVFDQLAMARLPRSTYALFVALLPATAAVVGVIVLRQLPTLVDLAGIALVMLAVALHKSDGEPATKVDAAAAGHAVSPGPHRVRSSPQSPGLATVNRPTSSLPNSVNHIVPSGAATRSSGCANGESTL